MYDQNIEQESSLMNAIDVFSIAGPVLGGIAGFGIRRTGAYKSALGAARKSAFTGGSVGGWSPNKRLSVFKYLSGDNLLGGAKYRDFRLAKPAVGGSLGIRHALVKNIAREAGENLERHAFSTVGSAISIGWQGNGARGVAHMLSYKPVTKLIAPALARMSTQVIKGGGIATAISVGYGLGKMTASALSYAGQDFSAQEFGIPYIDTQQAFTQRQAAVAAIHNSQLQTRSVFMREAQNFHM